MASQRANMIILSHEDNVGVALTDIEKGQPARDRLGVTLIPSESINQGHKLALREIRVGQQIIRFAMPVAVATQNIPRGALVHVHNVKSQYLNNDQDHYE